MKKSIRTLFAWKTIMTTSLVVLCVSCREYEYHYLHADKSEFYGSDPIFRNEQNNETKKLVADDYGCEEGESQRTGGNSSLIHVYIGEICGQAVKESDEALFALDHSVRSEIRYSTHSTHLIFEEDTFKMPDEDDDSTYHTTTWSWQNNVMTAVLVLTPVNSPVVIDSLYYARGLGIMKAFTRSGGTWIRV